MLNTLYLAVLLDQIYEKTPSQEKLYCSFFVPICFVVNGRCWPSKIFLPFLFLQEWQKNALPRMTAAPHLPLLLLNIKVYKMQKTNLEEYFR